MNKVTASRIKELRIRKGFSQEELANGSGLNLRSIQRIENGETRPLGNSIRKISEVLGTSPEELIAREHDDNSSLQMVVTLSALAFLLYPILGAVVPYLLWRVNKSGPNELDQVARDIVNFQITWNLIYFIGLYTLSLFMFPMLLLVIMYGLNIILILLNTFFLHMEKAPWYYPKVSFFKA